MITSTPAWSFPCVSRVVRKPHLANPRSESNHIGEEEPRDASAMWRALRWCSLRPEPAADLCRRLTLHLPLMFLHDCTII